MKNQHKQAYSEVVNVITWSMCTHAKLAQSLRAASLV